MAPGGTRVLTPEAGVISRLSGHDPALGELPGAVFGWSVYLTTARGFFFATHLGNRHVHVGQELDAGSIVGHVGHWPRDPARSHTHLGFTAHTGSRPASVHEIEAVARAPRVPGHWP